MCGDSTSIDAVDKLMDGQKADMIFTDPPYGIGYEYDEHKDDDNESNAQLVWDVFALHDCGKVWTPGLMNLARDIERFGKTKVAVWHKKFAMAGNGIGGASTWEPILILNAKKKSLKNDVLVIKTDKEYVDGKNLRELHSCPKPVGLYVELINSLAESKSNIFEPFCGSGTTLISCEKTTRKCFGMEMSPKYCDVIVKRWEDFTGKKATLLTAAAETV
jgi:DNA modification methylase